MAPPNLKRSRVLRIPKANPNLIPELSNPFLIPVVGDISPLLRLSDDVLNMIFSYLPVASFLPEPSKASNHSRSDSDSSEEVSPQLKGRKGRQYLGRSYETTDIQYPQNTLPHPVCRRLLPFTRAMRFQNIYLTSNEGLGRMVEVISFDPQFAEACQHLEISMPHPDESKRGAAHLKQILPHFSGLRRLSATSSSAVATLMLEAQASKSWFRHLVTLELEDPFITEGDPCSVRHFINLVNYRSLEKLVVKYSTTLASNPSRQAFMAQLTSEKYNVGANITFLHVQANFDYAYVPQLVRSFPALRQVKFEGTFGSFNNAGYGLALQAVPDTVMKVELKDVDRSTSVVEVPTVTSRHLAHLSDLEHLHLNTGYVSSDIFAYLCDPLPLRVLVLERWTNRGFTMELEQHHVEGLLKPGPGRLTSLKRLELHDLPILDKLGVEVESEEYQQVMEDFKNLADMAGVELGGDVGQIVASHEGRHMKPGC